MKVAVIGVGGIGGVMAACLTRAGVDVTPVVRNPEVARAIAVHGLRVRELDGQEWSVAPKRAPTPTADGAFDLAIVATQNTTLEEALRAAPARATIVTCQNGLPEERARAIVGDRVVGCVVGWGASMIEPGLYRRTSKGQLQLGFAGGPEVEPIAELLRPASPTLVVEDLQGVRWSKLAINCVTSTMGAIGGAPLGQLLLHRPLRRIALEVFAEVAAVARAAGVRVLPVGGTFEIDRLGITDAERAQTIGSPSLAYKHSILLAVGFKYRRMRSSMLYALERGRPPEVDYLNGEIVRRGAALGVPAPVNAALVESVRAIARGQAKSSIATLRALHADLVARRAA